MGVGEPDFVTPWEIRDAAIKSVQAGRTQYTSNAGLLSLREEIALYLNGRFSLSYDPGEEIIVTIGASEAIDLAMRTVVSAGTRCLYLLLATSVTRLPFYSAAEFPLR